MTPDDLQINLSGQRSTHGQGYAEDPCRAPEGRMTGDGAAPRPAWQTASDGMAFSTPLLDITTPMSPLQVIFDVAAYLRDHDNNETQMFDLIQRLKAACE